MRRGFVLYVSGRKDALRHLSGRKDALRVLTALAVLSCGALAGGAGSQAARAAVGAPALGAARAAAAGGTWGKAQKVPGPGGTYTSVDAISCASAGNCSAGGEYSGGQMFVVTETKGSWGKAEEVPGSAGLNTGGLADIDTMSCPSAGNCSAGGTYSVGSTSDEQAFVVTQTNGTWGKAEKVPGTGGLNAGDTAGVFSVSCASPGNCSAGGIYLSAAGKFEAFVVTQANGNWGKAEEVPGTGTLNTGGNASAGSVSCTAPGDCSVAGSYSGSNGGEAFVATETNGTWGNAKEIPGLASLSGNGTASVNSVSCPATGDCSAFGTESNGTTNLAEAFVVNETGGTWGNAQKVAGISALGAGATSWAGPEDCYSGDCPVLSCPSVGNCSAAGSYVAHGATNVFVVSETKGTWGTAEELPGISGLNVGKDAETYAVSCSSAGNCSAGGEYASRKNYTQYTQAFVVNETSGTWGTAEEVPGTGTLNTQTFAYVSSLSCAADGSCGAAGTYHSSTGGGFVVGKP